MHKLDSHPIGKAYVHVGTRSNFIQMNGSNATGIFVSKICLFIASHLERYEFYKLSLSDISDKLITMRIKFA